MKQRTLKNTLLIDGHIYDFIEDKEIDKCSRCALRKECDEFCESYEQGCEYICSAVFGWKNFTDHRFEEIIFGEINIRID